MSLGPEFGDAHIDVHADTRSIRRELRAAAQEAGKEFGKDWGKDAESSLGKELTVLGRHIEADLKKRGDQGGVNLAEALEAGVKRRLRNFDQDIADAALSGDWSRAIEGRFDNLGEAVDGVRARLRQMAKDSDLSKEAVQDLDGTFDAWAHRVRQDAIFQDLHDDALKMNVEFERTKVATKEAEKAFSGLWDEAHRLHQVFEDDRESHQKFADSLRVTREEVVTTKDDLIKMANAGSQVRESHEQMRRGADDVRRSFRRISDENDRMNGGFTVLGRLAGSRNNFLNLIGLAGGAAERGIEKAVSAILDPRGLIDAVKGLGDTIQENGGGIQGFFSTMGQSLTGIFGGGGDFTMLVKLGLAATALSSAVSLLGTAAALATTALSGLLAIATALVSSIGFGLIGMLLPIAPAALAIAAGVGAAVVAFQGLGDELKSAVEPMKEWFKAVQGPVRDRLFATLATDLGLFKDTLNNFVGPLLVAAAGELSDAFHHFTEMFNSEAVQSVLAGLGTTLPVILGDLATALGDFLTGALLFFTPIAEQTAIVSSNIASAAAAFETWAASAEGQTSIRDFMDKAATSAQGLWDLILALGGAIGTLLDQGKEKGDSFITSITGIVDEFTTWANSDEGRDKIAKWMAFGADLADKLWQLIQKVGEQIDRLDNDDNRQSLLRVIDLFTTLVGWMGNLLSIGAAAFHTLSDGWIKLSASVSDFIDWLGKVSGAASAALGSLGAWLAKPQAAIEKLTDMVKTLVGWIGKIKIPSAGSTTLGDIGHWLGFATGGLVAGPTRALVGEAGAEAIVPLERPLAMVDPSVRWLAAIAQGKGDKFAQGGIVGGRSLNVEAGAVQVFTSAADPAIVANEVFDRLVANAR